MVGWSWYDGKQLGDYPFSCIGFALEKYVPLSVPNDAMILAEALKVLLADLEAQHEVGKVTGSIKCPEPRPQESVSGERVG